MAQLKFSGIQPVEFNGRNCTPEVNTTGMRLRLDRIKFTSEADINEADEILAECFPQDKDYVYEFIHNHMTPTDKSILRSYLLEGEKAIAMLDRTSDAMAEKAVKEMAKHIEIKKEPDNE